MAAKKTTQAAPAGYAEAMTEIESICEYKSRTLPDAASRAIRAKAPSPDDHLRQLQFALKNKLRVGVRVDMPEGVVEIVMTPLGIAGGRFRGRDVEKEAERTLPLSRIQAVWLS
mgnify:CR=1 FL=1